MLLAFAGFCLSCCPYMATEAYFVGIKAIYTEVLRMQKVLEKL
jgi:hypothetical protein